MKPIIALFFISILIYSCGSKKRVITQRPSTERKTETARDQVEDNTTVVGERPGVTKTYASATEAYIDTYKEIAKREMELYHIPASITLAQGILESGSGRGRLSIEANNHFGIKCHDWTGKKIYHDDDRSQECFRKYNDAKYSFRDHSLFLAERKRYAFLFDLDKFDYKAWAKGLRTAGYATDRRYPQKLIDLIERYRLYQYDRENFVLESEPSVQVAESQIRHTVIKGDTLYSISKKYDTTVETLRKINGLKDNILSIGQILLIQL
ncbi:glucosaminidase domain-containing protein [Aestuariivivens sediminis]|uniref:glucosaminidase domain-containing protein n=1 Tax=Aestuariivivens sediminis TaxID=2913557 RepID=UPI001F5766B8|nr:glucosaminidase domain-containing protein [Aestuariivivens sediminis]